MVSRSATVQRIGEYQRISPSVQAALPRDCEMAASAQDQIVVEVADRPPSPKRPSRTLKPSAKVREAMQLIEDAATVAKTTTSEVTRTAASRGTRAVGTGYGVNGRIETGKSGLQLVVKAINEQRDEMHKMITEQRNTIGEPRDCD
ncbi:hypothetical protein N657DRAFT_684423 [Parathielavia appendiculata]|uniref:Uncharacterized protein n=1 Tax=Parathielavia appendiculata TaxID=2587402 RepID=A0AAN6TRM3_9PEZI|nr:hypothetical protein N657DRAFT_684423 [Parathielavia appendiculata]